MLNYQGLILAAHPHRQDAPARRSAILVVAHNNQQSLGLMLNKAITDSLDIQTVMDNSGIEGSLNGPVYWGGPDRVNRITVIHSLDWTSTTTIKISAGLGMTCDTSVLTALNSGAGPKLYRVILGHIKWPPGELDREMSISDQRFSSDSWIWCRPNPDLIFGSDGRDQWRQIIAAAGQQQINQWFESA